MPLTAVAFYSPCYHQVSLKPNYLQLSFVLQQDPHRKVTNRLPQATCAQGMSTASKVGVACKISNYATCTFHHVDIMSLSVVQTVRISLVAFIITPHITETNAKLLVNTICRCIFNWISLYNLEMWNHKKLLTIYRSYSQQGQQEQQQQFLHFLWSHLETTKVNRDMRVIKTYIMQHCIIIHKGIA